MEEFSHKHSGKTAFHQQLQYSVNDLPLQDVVLTLQKHDVCETFICSSWKLFKEIIQVGFCQVACKRQLFFFFFFFFFQTERSKQFREHEEHTAFGLDLKKPLIIDSHFFLGGNIYIYWEMPYILKVRWRAFDGKAHKKGELQIAADKACITMRMQQHLADI